MLTDEQRKWIAELAQEQDKSGAEVVRDALDFYRRWLPVVDVLRTMPRSNGDA